MTEHRTGRWTLASRRVRDELQHLVRFNASQRPWEMPLAAAASTGVPLIVGAATGQMVFGLVASLGGLVFLSLPDTRMQHRIVSMMAAAFGMVACYALGALTHFFPPAMIVALTLLTIVASMVGRYYRVAPPGILFPVMAASIAAYTPGTFLDIPMRTGLVALGALFAFAVAIAYSVYHLRRASPGTVAPTPGMDFDYVVVDSVIIGASVGASLTLAELLQLERPYWVPVSCLAIIQGANLRMVWNRHLHRLLGTGAGLLLAWLLLELRLDDWGVVAAMLALSFAIEILVVRHYGLAVVLITPLTIFLAEFAHLGQGSSSALIQTRALDIALGCLVGLAGGIALHVPRIRDRVGRWMAALRPGER